MANKDYF